MNINEDLSDNGNSRDRQTLMSNFIPHFISRQFINGADHGDFQAATLFVDVCGFTQLTETLMRHKKDGAEVLAEALDAIFTPLVQEVHACGGLIPLFAGDAFTAIFPLDSVEQLAGMPSVSRQALHAATSIQAFLNPQGQDRIFSTKYGEFAIGVGIGLSLGSVQWGIPGKGDHYAFYFRGPGVDGCARAAKVAWKGEIIAHDMILPKIQDYVKATSVAGLSCRKLIDCVLDPMKPSVPLESFARAELLPFVPESILDLTVEAELRHVCPIFTSFEEPSEHTLLHEFVTQAMTLAAQYGGHLHQIDFGDKGGLLVVLFGAPVAFENSVARAAEFVLAMQSTYSGLRWRAGITFGTAWAGIRGGGERREYGVIGDVMNSAARLALRASWGDIWAGQAAYEGLRKEYQLDEMGVLHLRGKSAPLAAYCLGGKKQVVDSGLFTGAMVGRDAELTVLEKFLNPVFEGRFAGIAHICADAGMGKTRLVYELRQRLCLQRDMSWFLCPADEILRQSLNPFKYFLRQYFHQSPDQSLATNKVSFDAVFETLLLHVQNSDAEADKIIHLTSELNRTRSFLGALVDLHWEGSLYERLDPKLRLENALAAFKALIKAESLRRPVILQLEDLHWLDDDSGEFLTALTRNVAAYAFVVVCTSRYRDEGSRIALNVDDTVPQQIIDLIRLDLKAINDLACELLGGGISEELEAFLAAKTGGNPFFVEQLLLDLRERGVLRLDTGQRWALQASEAKVPTKIGAVLIARLDRLSAQIKEVVQTAAVLGREFEVRLLSQMLHDEHGVPEKVKEAESGRIWSALSEIRYMFRHTMMRDAAYDMQLQARLRGLHRLAAEAMEQMYSSDFSPHYVDLAYHWGRAEVADRERYYAEEAGKQAAAQYAIHEAVAYFSRALDLLPEDKTIDRYDLLMARERVAAMQGDREAQARDLVALEGLADSLDDSKKRAKVALCRAHFAEATGDFPAAIAAGKAAIEFSRASGERCSEAAGFRLWGGALLRQGNYDGARSALDRALDLIGDTGDRNEETTILLNQGTVSTHQGDYRAAQDWFERALGIAQEAGDAMGEGSILNNLGSAHYHLGEYASARSYFERSFLLCQQIGHRMSECNALGNVATVSAEQGDYANARTGYEEALHVRREIGDTRGQCLTLNNLGKISCDVGDYTKARSFLEEALCLCRQIGVKPIEGAVLVNLTMLFHLAGDHESAHDSGKQALCIAEELGEQHMLGYALDSIGHAFEGAGKQEEAAAAYRRALQARRELGQDVLALEAAAGLARVSLTQEKREEALEQVEQILCHLQTGTLEGTSQPLEIYLTCYHVLRVNHDSRSQDTLAKAYSLLQERASKIDDPEIRHSFLERVAAHREIVHEYGQGSQP